MIYAAYIAALFPLLAFAIPTPTPSHWSGPPLCEEAGCDYDKSWEYEDENGDPTTNPDPDCIDVSRTPAVGNQDGQCDCAGSGDCQPAPLTCSVSYTFTVTLVGSNCPQRKMCKWVDNIFYTGWNCYDNDGSTTNSNSTSETVTASPTSAARRFLRPIRSLGAAPARYPPSRRRRSAV